MLYSFVSLRRECPSGPRVHHPRSYPRRFRGKYGDTYNPNPEPTHILPSERATLPATQEQGVQSTRPAPTAPSTSAHHCTTRLELPLQSQSVPIHPSTIARFHSFLVSVIATFELASPTATTVCANPYPTIPKRQIPSPGRTENQQAYQI